VRGSIVESEDLYAILKLERAGDVVRCLRKQGIAVFIGKGGEPWTTIELINQAGGLKAANADETYPADAFR
jgi:hypothetical protein